MKGYNGASGRTGTADTREKVEREREHGAFWYSWLWALLRPLLIALCAVLVTGGIVMSIVNSVKENYFDAVDSNDPAPVAFSVASGSSLSSVAAKLEEQGLVRNRTVFKYYADLLGYGQKIQTGEYVLNRTMGISEILDRLTAGDGRPLTRMITVVPGQSVRDMAVKLFDTDSERQEFVSLCQDREKWNAYYYISDVNALGSAAYRPYILEGYLAADTYEVYTSATPEQIIRKLLSQTQAVFPAEYEERANEIGMTMDDVITLASVIEKEAKTDDFARVSAVFHNRLNTAASQQVRGTNSALDEANGKLESDATVKYWTGSEKMALTDSDLQAYSPYNTYRNTGLPAGPVCSPGKNAILAALYPDEDMMRAGYLYFCSKAPESGELCFAVTYQEHQLNVSIYRPLWEAYDRRKGNN